MGYERFTTGVLDGLNEDENPHALRDGELVEAVNVARIGNAVGTRPGAKRPGASEDYEDGLTENEPIQGMFEYRSDFDANRTLIVVADDTDYPVTTSMIFHEDDARLPVNGNPTMTADQDDLWTFAEHRNILWAAGGAAADDVWTWDGVAGTGTGPLVPGITEKSDGATLRPQFVFAFQNYLLFNGLRTSARTPSNNAMVTRYQTFGTDPTVDASWPDSNTIGYNAFRPGLPSYGSEFSTGMAQYIDNESRVLLLLGNRSLNAVELDTGADFKVVDAIPNGCVHQRAFVSLGLDSGEAIYLSDRGVHSLRQSQQHGARDDKFLSWKIRNTFESLNRSRLQYATGAYDPVNGWVVFAVTTGENTAHDLLLVLDVKDTNDITSETARWYLWRLEGGLLVNELLFARSAAGAPRLYFGSTLGDVGYITTETFRDFDSATATFSAYTTTFQTKHRADYAGGNLLDQKTVGDAVITLLPGGNYAPTARFIFDYGARSSVVYSMDMPASAAIVGTSLVGRSVVGGDTPVGDARIYGVGAGRTVSFRFSHGGEDEPFRVGRVDYEIEVGGESSVAS